ALKDCDWGLDFGKGVDPVMTLCMKGRQLTKLAFLRASYSFQKKEAVAAVADLASGVKTGRHIGRNGPFIATLFQFAIDNSAIDVAAAYLPQNAKTLKALGACVEAWQRTSPLGQAMQGEKAFLLQCMRPQLRNKSSKEAFELLRGHELLRTHESEEEVKAI